MANKQDRAVAAANQLIQIAAQMLAVRQAAQAYLAQDTSENYDAVFSAMPTAVFNADGTVGTADGSPVLTHPISVPAGAPLLRSRNQLNSMKLLLSDFMNFLNNAAVATSNRAPVLDDLVS